MIRIVIPTQKTEEEYKQTTQYQCLEKLQTEFVVDEERHIIAKKLFEIEIIGENKKGLSKVYNAPLLRVQWNWKYATDDIMVFLHDDLEVHDQFFIQKLLKAHETYDIVGLAGATTQKYTYEKSSVWHLCRENATDARGMVSHYIPKGFNNVSESHYNSAYFGPTPSEVVVIDGLFISVKVKALADKGVTFDDDFDFHHYDMAFCLKARQKGLKIGVWPIFCVHHGLGEFDTPEWKTSHHKFITKYYDKQHIK